MRSLTVLVLLEIALDHNLAVNTLLDNPEKQEENMDSTSLQASGVESMKPIFKKIMSVKDIKNDFFSVDSKRALVSSHDMFLTDNRIINNLLKILGGRFYLTHKASGSDDLLAKGLKNELWIGTTNMPAGHLAENTEKAVVLNKEDNDVEMADEKEKDEGKADEKNEKMRRHRIKKKNRKSSSSDKS
ncbi:hypothetical protein BX667DRAFT_532452 [Coemansia mojavensis]|nr:hypothetical protein BX667DRAFT_532452 [Coemansia mojavensis]